MGFMGGEHESLDLKQLNYLLADVCPAVGSQVATFALLSFKII